MGTQPPSIFGPCLLWPKNWMDQDATWWGGRPRPRGHCVLYLTTTNTTTVATATAAAAAPAAPAAPATTTTTTTTTNFIVSILVPVFQVFQSSLLWHCWLGVRKSTRPVKYWVMTAAMVICLQQVQIICIWSSWCHCHPHHLLLH